jgi:anti-sigma B factor antagonist
VSRQSLRIAHETIGSALVVHVAGEIDLVTAPELQAQLDKVCAQARPPQIVVADLSAVGFMGSAGLTVLIDADKRCRAQLVRLRIVATNPATIRPLQVTGLDRVLDLAGSLDGVIRSA